MYCYLSEQFRVDRVGHLVLLNGTVCFNIFEHTSSLSASLNIYIYICVNIHTIYIYIYTPLSLYKQNIYMNIHTIYIYIYVLDSHRRRSAALGPGPRDPGPGPWDRGPGARARAI